MSSSFTPFGTEHLITLACILVLAAALPLAVRRYQSGRPRHVWAAGIAVALLVHEVAKVGVRVFGFGEPLGQSLPLHLCGMAALLTAWTLWRRSYPAFEVAYFWGIGGSLSALVFPDLLYGFPHPFFLIFFSGHGLILVGVLYATLVYRFRPTLRSLGRTLAVTLALMAVIAPVNGLLDANYWYLCAKPAQATLIDSLGPWPWYILSLIAVGLAVSLLCYLPFAFSGRQAGERPGTT